VWRGTLILLHVLLCVPLAAVQEQKAAALFREWTGKRILVISPHPDDDIIGCGGAFALLSGRDNHLLVVYLSTGEKGTFDTSLTSDAVRTIRKREAGAAYRTLGFPDAELLWFDYPDGELDFAPQLEIRQKLVSLIRRRRPDVIFAPDAGGKFYRYHYRDHRSAALVSADAVGAAMWPLEYPEPGVAAFRVPEAFYFYTAEPNVELPISDVYDRKLAALAQHRSQFPPASEQYSAQGPPPARADMEQLISFLTGAAQVEYFRQR
jgi:N,N'-diacetylchitobiose non-reducing end deacetylase